LGRRAVAGCEQALALCSFIGESALLFGAALIPKRGSVVGPVRWRWRPVWRAVQIDGFEALPIIGLTAFLLGIVVAYQGAGQLRLYGASIFVVDLVGLSILREFSPLITAIIVAGRSGSAYAAQIGTMAVTEEIDALRTLGIEPIELLVLPKILALLLVLPLLTVFADLAGVAGGMLMARLQLNIGAVEFVDRFALAVDLAAFLLGVGKALVFALIIVVIGCFQGFRTHGVTDSVGRQTTRSVVQAIFLVIVADALFSVVFSLLEL
jgi:phospholipid/cholesterol/gamma-HCH transport system permease protein